MRKQLFALMVLLVVLVTVAAQCAAPATEAPPPAKTEEAAPAKTEEAAPAKTEEAAPAEEAFRVGLVTDVGKVNDGTFNQYAYEGMMRAVEEFGLDSAFIETQQPTDYEKNVEQFIDEGYDMIVTVGFMMGETTQKEAEANPDVHFAIVDFAYDPPIPNVMGLVFREDQAGFLAGALAGMMTESKTVGIVAGMEIPPVKKFRNGYENGVHYVCPDCSVIGVYIDSFTDPARGKAAAQSQIAEGADVIFGAGGPTGSGGILGAAQQGVWVIGVDQDEYYTTFKGGEEAGADKLLSSAMKRVDVAVYTAIKEAYEGTFEGRTAVFDAASNGVGLAPFHETEDAVPQEVKDKLDEIFQMLASGELDTGVDPVSGDMVGMPGAPAAEEVNLVMSFVPSGDTEEILASGEEIARMLSERTGYNVTANVATSYAAVIEAMGAGNAQIGWLNTFGYVLAHEKYGVEVALATVRFGSTSYKGQIITRADSGITSIEDLKGKTFCRPDPLSTSGWIVPSITMAAAGLDPETDIKVVDAGSHNNVVAAVYNGDCDAGATYVDARGTVEDDFPDVKEKVVVIAESADIPNDTVSFAPDVPPEVRETVVNALLEIAQTEEGAAALEQVYEIAGLEPVDDSFYDGFRADLDASGYSIEDLLKE